jgi:hypothetical protein
MYLSRDSNVYKLVAATASPNSFAWRVVNSTNRVLVINRRYVPLVFDYDETFGTSYEKNVGPFGKRDGTIVRGKTVHHGHILTFNTSGNILSILP